MTRVHQDIIAGIVMILISLIIFYQSMDLIWEVALYPVVLASIFVIFALLVIRIGIIKTKKISEGKEVELDNEEEQLTLAKLKSPMGLFLIIIIYVALINVFGFFLSTTLFLTFYLWTQREKNWIVYLLLIIGFNVFAYFIFVYQLNVRLPQGMFF